MLTRVFPAKRSFPPVSLVASRTLQLHSNPSPRKMPGRRSSLFRVTVIALLPFYRNTGCGDISAEVYSVRLQGLFQLGFSMLRDLQALQKSFQGILVPPAFELGVVTFRGRALRQDKRKTHAIRTGADDL